MDYTEMLCAAAVHDLALKLKTTALQQYFRSLQQDDEAKLEKQEKWQAENPTVNFVPAALARLESVMAIMRSK
jgi:hypothetical protein